MKPCRELRIVIIVRDEELVEESLVTGQLVCPACGGRLRKHGYSPQRSVRTRYGGCRSLRPARVRCTVAQCGRTQVLLPSWCVPGRTDDADTIGSALVAAAAGQGHRRIAARLGLPPDTVRGWLRAARAHAGWLYRAAVTTQGRFSVGSEDPVTPRPAGSPLGDAVDALGAAAATVKRFLGAATRTSAWPLIIVITGGRLLRPLRRRSD